MPGNQRRPCPGTRPRVHGHFVEIEPDQSRKRRMRAIANAVAKTAIEPMAA